MSHLTFSVSNTPSRFNHRRGVWGGRASGPSSFTSTVCSVRPADRRTMFVFTHLLQELRLDCTVKNGPGLLLGLFFFPPQHNFPPVNWSVFASLSTPAKQHLPWSYRISIRSFPNVALSQLRCFCSYMVASVIFAPGSYGLPLLWGSSLGSPLKSLSEFTTSALCCLAAKICEN